MKIRGTVERVEGREAVIRTSEGRQVRVMIGPESYWEDRGYHMAPGQSILVNGWYPEDNTDWFYAGSIAGPGFSFSLTNSSGMPYWVDRQEQQRSRPSYVVYRDWYGPRYIYSPPPRHGPRNHDEKERHDRSGH